MPRKKKDQLPLPPKRPLVKLTFSDLTVGKYNGNFKSIAKDIESEFPFPKIWTIKTDLSISSEVGDCFFELDLNESGNVYILSYGGSMIPSKDISVLSSWCSEKGWKTPIPSETLVKDNVFFWKNIWETLLVNSEYLEKRFGQRLSEQLINNTAPEEEEDEDEEF